MTFLLFLIIALGWMGALWAWGRNRTLGGGPALHMPSLQASQGGALSSPRTPAMARRRRREVLGALAIVSLTSLLLTRAWSAFWFVAVLGILAFAVYLWAVAMIERPELRDSRPRFAPVLEDDTIRRPVVSGSAPSAR